MGYTKKDAHLNLLKDIQRSLNGFQSKPYSNSGAIIQSSGYGKSRTVDQLATLVPTIPINVRPFQETTTGDAFPHPNAVLNEFFFEFATQYNSGQAVAKILVFLKSLFTCYTELVKIVKNDTNFRADEDDPAVLATSIRTYLQKTDIRDELYENVVATFWKSPVRISEDSDPSFAEIRSLAGLVDELGRKNYKPGLIIYIDEARTLANKELKTPPSFSRAEMKDQARETMYTLMLTALSSMRDACGRLCVLFLSTDSQLAIADTPKRETLPSTFRIEQPRPHLMVPFTEMPFDCHPSLTTNCDEQGQQPSIKPGLMLKDVQDFAFMVRFGRPLFWTYYENLIPCFPNWSDYAMVEVQVLAKKKLTGLSIPETWDKHSNRDCIILAILDVVLNLHYVKARSSDIVCKLVAGHMRTVFSIPADCTYMETGYPSEPILAEAALDLIYCQKDTERLGSMASMLLTFDENTPGAIDKGEHIENVGKMLLLTAYMNAVASEAESNAPQWRQGCSLISFLEHLAAETHHEVILNNRPDFDASGMPMNETFKNSWVRFTHFVRAGDDSAMTSSMSWVAFVREMAVIGCSSQEGILHIPILLDINQPISETNISAFLVQLKVRERHSQKSTVAISSEEIIYFPPPGSCRDPFRDGTLGDEEEERKAHRSRPYISLVMVLRVYDGGEKTSIHREVVASYLDKCTSSNKTHMAQQKCSTDEIEQDFSLEKETRNTDHPRYSLFFYGCSHEIYRVISSSSPDYKNLLHVSSIFDDHPTGRPIEPVLAMKPYWKAGSTCFSWIDEPYFIGLPDEMPTAENATVLVGSDMFIDSQITNI